MKAVPAVDLREGACVQLVGGRFEDERVRIADPLVAAARWRGAGFTSVHVVDLDAALGRGDNTAVIDRLVRESGLSCAVGGGVRDEARVEALLGLGAARVVVGTRALSDPAWLAALATRFPQRLVLAADVRGREVVARGWTESTGRDIGDVLRSVAALPLAGVLVTSVQVEGQMTGPDVGLIRALAQETRHPLFASGGVGRHEDLQRLADAGAAEVVMGMALYTGALDPERVAREFAR